MPQIALTRIAGIPDAGHDWSLVSSSPASDGSLLFLFVERGGNEAVRETYSQGIGTFQRTQMESAKRFKLIRQSAEKHQTHELPKLDVTFPKIDVFPDGKILVAGTRCAWRGEGDYDLNGVVFDPASGRCERILLGDGIADVFVDDRGRIWTSYFDEGIFGNFGWGLPGPAPIGAAGLVCFAKNGRRIWDLSEADTGLMADCSAMNMSGASAAIYFYTDYPLCKISSAFELEFWKTDLQGCRTFAILDNTVLFSAQYGDDPGTAYLGTLLDDRFESRMKLNLHLPNQSGLPNGRFVGRGSKMYFFDDTAVHCTDLIDL